MYLDHWVSFSNPVFAVSLEHPVNWQPVPGYGGDENGEVRFAGDNGFFHISAMDAATGIDAVAANEAGHRLQPYDSHPTIESLQIQGQEVRLIMPSEDQRGMGHQAALIVRYPQPVTISDVPCRYFVLWADYPHIRTIAQTLQFGTGSGG